MLEGKVIKDFNDGKNNLKKYTQGKIFRAENERYRELQAKGYVSEGKEVSSKDSK